MIHAVLVILFYLVGALVVLAIGAWALSTGPLGVLLAICLVVGGFYLLIPSRSRLNRPRSGA